MCARLVRADAYQSVRLEGAGMDILIPIIGITCIALLIYYIYILMRSDS